MHVRGWGISWGVFPHTRVHLMEVKNVFGWVFISMLYFLHKVDAKLLVSPDNLVTSRCDNPNEKGQRFSKRPALECARYCDILWLYRILYAWFNHCQSFFVTLGKNQHVELHVVYQYPGTHVSYKACKSPEQSIRWKAPSGNEKHILSCPQPPNPCFYVVDSVRGWVMATSPWWRVWLSLAIKSLLLPEEWGTAKPDSFYTCHAPDCHLYSNTLRD